MSDDVALPLEFTSSILPGRLLRFCRLLGLLLRQSTLQNGRIQRLTASVRAPLTGIVLVLEMTDNYQLILPMIITCLGATPGRLLRFCRLLGLLLRQSTLQNGRIQRLTAEELRQLLAASVRAPLTGIVLVLEMTDNYQLILPMIITCLVCRLLGLLLRQSTLQNGRIQRLTAEELRQ
jgi:hypothetical protein